MDPVRRLALQSLEAQAPSIPDWPMATVKTITPGGGTDGLALITVRYDGADLKFSCFTHYTPAVGDRVCLGRAGGNWVIIGRPGGFPPPTGA